MSRFDSCLAEVLRHEGGWSDHPKDPGGATMQGITLATYSDHLGRQATKDELRNIPASVRDAIYRKRYWDVVSGDSLPAGVDLSVFDIAVNSGPGRAGRILQSCLGVVVDGAIGPRTLDAVLSAEDAPLINEIAARRMAFLRSLPTWTTFGSGWARRVADVQKTAIKMASG